MRILASKRRERGPLSNTCGPPWFSAISMSTTKTVTKAAGIMMAAIFLSRLLGLVREMVIANQFGAGGLVSAYGVAFNLPDLLYFLLSSGALSSAFIPVFTEYWTKGETDKAWEVFSIIGTLIFLVLAVLIIAFEIFAPQLVPLVAPGFARQHRDLLAITIYLTRIVLPAQMFFFIGGLIIGTLYSRQHFVAPALGPIIYNIGIISGGVFFASKLGISSLMWGALVGAFIGNCLLQILAVRRLGVTFKPSLNLSHPGVKKVGKLALPVLLGLSLPYVNVIFNRWFATYLEEGAVAALNYANRLMQMPLGVFAQASAVALFPTLAEQAARKEMDQLRASVNFGLRGIFLLTVPSSVLMIVLATPIVRMLFQHGQFTSADAPYVGYALAMYSIGIAAWSGQAIVTRGFYAMQDTVVPVVVGTIMTFVFIPMNWLFMRPLGHGGLALATSVAAILNMVILLELLRRRLGGLNGGLIMRSFTKVCASSAVAGGVAWMVFHAVSRVINPNTPMGSLVGVVASLGLALLAYISMIVALRVDEAREVWRILSARLRRGKGEAHLPGAEGL